jgi:Glycosyl transferase family 2
MSTSGAARARTADVVIPTVGRPALHRLVAGLAAEDLSGVRSVTVVDDRRCPDPTGLGTWLDGVGFAVPALVLATGGRGPAAARNAGWRVGRALWVVFLDDDVVVTPGWGRALAADLAAASAAPRVAAVRAQVRVPLATDRRPTDWERQVGALAEAPGWITADLAVRRVALEQVGGLDSGFPRAHREDTDLELRLRAAGWAGARGTRATVHPVGDADRWVSVRRQAGNADDVRLTRLHGRSWRERVGEPRGAIGQHVATVAAGATAAAAGLAGRRPLAAGAAAAWALATARFAWRRIGAGPRTRDEVATMVLTSVAIPPVAIYHRARGWLSRL